MTVVSAREFNRDVSAAKRAADREPVTVTDRGEPAYVLLNISEYRRLLASSNRNEQFLAEMSMGDEYAEVEFPRMDFQPRDVNF